MAPLELLEAETVPLRVEEDGTIRVGKTRVTLDIVLGAYNLGQSAEEMTRMYTTLQLEEIRAVIDYYLRHREEMDAYLERRRLETEEIWRQIEEICPPDKFRDRIAARRAQIK